MIRKTNAKITPMKGKTVLSATGSSSPAVDDAEGETGKQWLHFG
jgi:hypothetical protein